MSMSLTILSTSSAKQVTVDWIELETLVGNLVIQSGHAPTKIVVKPNSPFQWSLSSGSLEKITITHGFLEIQRDRALLILD